jgi:hypothetical protein
VLGAQCGMAVVKHSEQHTATTSAWGVQGGAAADDGIKTRHVAFHTAPAAEEGSTARQAAVTSRLVKDHTTTPAVPLDILVTHWPSAPGGKCVLCLSVVTSANPHQTVGAVMNVARNTGAGTMRVEGFDQSLQVTRLLQQLPEHLRDSFEELVMEVVLIDPESAGREFEELQLVLVEKVFYGILYLRKPGEQCTLQQLFEAEHPAEGFPLKRYKVHAQVSGTRLISLKVVVSTAQRTRHLIL